MLISPLYRQYLLWLCCVVFLAGRAVIVAQPANDLFANRFLISGSPVSTNGTTSLATAELGEPYRIDGKVPEHTVWWRWTATFSGPATAVVSSPNQIPFAGVFQGNTLTTLTEVSQGTGGAAKIVGGLAYLTREAQFTAVAGQEYSIAVDTSSQIYLLAITASPTAAVTAPAADSDFPLGVDIPVRATVADLDGSLGQVDFFAKTFSMTGGTVIGSASTAPYEILWTNTVPGKYEVYSRVIDNSGARTFSPRITVRIAPPLNDDFIDRIPLTGSPAFGSSTNAAATKEPGEPASINGSNTTATVWWSWTAPSDGSYTVLATISQVPIYRGLGPIIGVFTGTSVSNLALVAGGRWRISFNARAGTEYELAIDGPAEGPGTANITITRTPQMTITSPANGATFVAGADIPVSASAVDADGQIESVYYFVETDYGLQMTVPSGSNPPYAGLWRSVSPGQRTLYGYCTDDLGVGASDTVTVNVILPPNDDFANRFVLAGAQVQTNSSTFFAGAEPGEDIINPVATHSVWWTWTAPSNGTYAVVTVASNYDSPSVYTGTTLSNLTLVPGDWSIDSSTAQIVFQAVAGTAYQIAVDSPIGGAFTLSITRPPSLQVLTPQPEFDFAANEPIQFSVIASDPDGQIERLIYSIHDLSSGHPRVTVTNSTPPFSLVLTNLPRGRYWLFAKAVDNFGASAAVSYLPFTVGRPSNDDFADRLRLTGSPVHTNGTTFLASQEPLEPSYLGYAVDTVWYTWKAPASGNYSVLITTSDVQAQLGVFTGDNLYALSPIGTVRQVASTYSNQITYYTREAPFSASANTEYVIGVSGYDLPFGETFTLTITRAPQITITSPASNADFSVGTVVPLQVVTDDPDGQVVRVEYYMTNQVGNLRWISVSTNPPFSLAWTGSVASAQTMAARAIDNDGATSMSGPLWFTVGRPGNDDFTNAFVLSGSPAFGHGSNGGANWEASEGYPFEGAQTVWWRWTAPRTGHYTASVICSNSSAIIDIFSGGSLSSLVKISSYTQIETVTNNQSPWLVSQSKFDADADTTCYVRINSRWGYGIDFDLLVSADPEISLVHPAQNADFPPGTNVLLRAIATDWDGTVTRVDFELNRPFYLPLPLGSVSSPPYSFVLTNVYRGRYTITARAYDDLGISSASEPDTFSVGRPGNDDFAQRLRLTGSSVSTTGSLVAASIEPGESGNPWEESVWWDWSPPTAGEYTIRLENIPPFSASVLVYVGSSISNLTQLSLNSSSLTQGDHFLANPAKTYHIAVKSWIISPGDDFLLRIFPTPPPANDNFADRVSIYDRACPVYVDNTAATVEPGEPTHAGVPNAGSVWYKWVIPRTSIATITTSAYNQSIDPVVAVYKGTNLTTLVPIASDDDSGGYFNSKVTFTAVGDQEYQVAIGSFGGLSGMIPVCFSSEPLPAAISGWGLENGRMKLTINSPEGDQIWIESSTDLQNWSFHDYQIVPASGVLELHYEPAESHRFFRARH